MSGGLAINTERRREQRRILRTAAFILLPQRQPIEVRTADISLGGMGIITPASPPPKITFGVRLALPNRTGGTSPFEAQVKVMNSIYSSAEGGFKVGVSFVDLPAPLTAALKTYLSP